MGARQAMVLNAELNKTQNQRRIVMKWLINKTRNFLREEEGVTAIEYGLIAALIAVAIIVAVGAVGTSLTDTFNTVDQSLADAPAAQ